MPKHDFDDILHRQHPVTLPATASVHAACAAMHTAQARVALVVDGQQRLLGIFAGRDAVNLIARGDDPRTATLDQAMTRAPECLPPDATAIEALRLMADGGFRHVPIVDRGRVVGVVARRDLPARAHLRLEEEAHLWTCR
jgi:CBS domain-containing protein